MKRLLCCMLVLLIFCLFPVSILAGAEEQDPTELVIENQSDSEDLIYLESDEYEAILNEIIEAGVAGATEEERQTIFSSRMQARSSDETSLTTVKEDTRFMPWNRVLDTLFEAESKADNLIAAGFEIIKGASEYLVDILNEAEHGEGYDVTVPDYNYFLGKQRIEYYNNSAVEIVTLSIGMTQTKAKYGSHKFVSEWVWNITREYVSSSMPEVVATSYSGTLSPIESNALVFGSHSRATIWNGSEVLTSQNSQYSRIASGQAYRTDPDAEDGRLGIGAAHCQFFFETYTVNGIRQSISKPTSLVSLSNFFTSSAVSSFPTSYALWSAVTSGTNNYETYLDMNVDKVEGGTFPQSTYFDAEFKAGDIINKSTVKKYYDMGITYNGNQYQYDNSQLKNYVNTTYSQQVYNQYYTNYESFPAVGDTITNITNIYNPFTLPDTELEPTNATYPTEPSINPTCPATCPTSPPVTVPTTDYILEIESYDIDYSVGIDEPYGELQSFAKLPKGIVKDINIFFEIFFEYVPSDVIGILAFILLLSIVTWFLFR